MPDVAEVAEANSLEALYSTLDSMQMTAGWIDRPEPILRREPATGFAPAHWRYDECRAALDAAGRLIDTELAERRNLVMRNPVDPAGVATTRTLVAAYQMILPGETARSHRHAPHALRVIIDAEGAYSTVDGVKTPMDTGDVVLTPGWQWHGHGHDGDRPAYWFDGLDVPLVHLLEPMFVEDHPDGFERVETVTEDSPLRFSRDSIRRGLDAAAPDPEGVEGARVALDAPDIPTMGLTVHRFESGARTRPRRATANAVFCVMEGGGTTTVDGAAIHWSRGDAFAAPMWRWTGHEASEDSVLFRMTDAPLMRFARYYREETG